MKKKKCIIICLLLIFIIGLISIFSKTTFSYDESFSFALSNWFEKPYSGWVSYDSNQWLSKELLNNPYIYTGNGFNLSGVISNQASDVHLPLFYIIMRIIAYIFKGRFSIYIYLLFNLCLLLVSSYFIYKIVNLVVNNCTFASICSLLYGTSTFALDNITFIRMYQLASTLVIIYIYLALLIAENKMNKSFYYIFLFITIIAGGLTHYYFYVATLLFSLVLAIYLIIKKQYMKVILSVVIYVVALLLNILLIFPGTMNHFAYSHGEYALKQIGKFDFVRILSYVNLSPLRLIVFVIALIAIIAFLYFYFKKQIQNMYPLILILSYFLYLIVVSQISVQSIDRIMFLIDPICIIGILTSFYYIFMNKKQLLFVVITPIALANIVYVIANNNISIEKSWDFAKKHQDDVAIVYVDKNSVYEYNDIQSSLFADLRWYLGVYVSDQYDQGGYMDGDRNFVLYVDKRVDLDDFLVKAKEYYYNPSKYSLDELDINTSGFLVYYGQAK